MNARITGHSAVEAAFARLSPSNVSGRFVLRFNPRNRAYAASPFSKLSDAVSIDQFHAMLQLALESNNTMNFEA